MEKKVLILLAIIIGLGFIFRLYRFNNPPADWHAFRQSDTNAVSQRFANEGINILYPKYFDISNVQSGLDNPEGLRYVELPIYNAIQASLYKYIGILNLIEWGRLISIFASLSSVIFIFLLTRKYAGIQAALFAAAIYSFLPFSIFYGRTILPDTSMTASIMAGIYLFDKWITLEVKHKKKDLRDKILSEKTLLYLGAVFFTGLSFLLKPFALFFTLPIAFLIFKRYGFSLVKKWQVYLFTLLTLGPLVFWRIWISQFPEGIPASDWLFNGNGIRFRPAFFRWIFYERITNLILGYTGVFTLGAGLLSLSKAKSIGFFVSFIVASLLYLSVIATGNVQHDYYQILIIPTIAMISGIGFSTFFDWLRIRLNLYPAIFISALVAISAFYLSWNQVKDYFNINDRAMVAAGQRANEILPEDAIVIAPYDGSTTLLNITARAGWPVFQKSIEELIELGATHLVISSPTENDFSGFGENYKRLDSSKEYLILELK